MKQPFIFTVVLISMLIANSTFGQTSSIQQASYEHKPIVEMTINDQKTWVLLDTGSDITILDIKSKRKLGFGTIANTNYSVPGFGSENNQLHRAKNVNLLFGETPLRCAMYAFDLTNIAESIEARTGKRITAIIGTTLMQSYGFVIDMGNNSVAMYQTKNNE